MSTLHLTPSGDPQSPSEMRGEIVEEGSGGGGSQGRTEGWGREGRAREPRKDRGMGERGEGEGAKV